METLVDSEVETDGAEPDKISTEFVDVELQQQQQQQQRPVKRVIADDGSELVVLTAAQYNEIVKRQQVADRLCDQLHDERRQRLEISQKCRVCSEALVRENDRVMRYRQLLISNHALQLTPVDDANVRATVELPETFFKDDRVGGEVFQLRGRCLPGSARSDTESIQTTEEVAPSGAEVTQTTSGRVPRSALEPDDATVIARPVFSDTAGLPALHDHRQNSSGAEKVTAATEEGRGSQEKTGRHRQLLDEANDALTTVTRTSSTTSRDFVQKVLEQNARLKQLLRKIVDTQGMTIREFLVSYCVC